MSTVQEYPDFPENLAHLQAQSLQFIALFAAVLSHIWLGWLVWPAARTSRSVCAWVGLVLLVLGASAGYGLRTRRPQIAPLLLIGGILGAAACAVLTFPLSAVVYLFILPVVFASVLLSSLGFFSVTVVALVLVLIVGPAHQGMGLLSTGVALPIGIITLVAMASWVAARNLRTALAWVWSGYEQALRNEEVARLRSGELRRALKALDEATHRLERMNYMLARARDQAEEARRLKQQFAQTVSHELRAPLNLIVGFTELMAHSPEYYGSQLAPEYLRDLSIVYRNACHLQNLVSDVLDLARIEAAQMSLVLEETSPATLVQEAVDTARSLVESRGLELRTEVEPDLPALWVDPVRVRQVLFNLLNNATRFTDKGSITVSVGQEGEEVIFAVVDTGIGIAPEHIDRIFEEFEQADGGTRRRHGGAGLGLAISKQFVKLHSGRIWVESQLGKGSAFYFGLPTEQFDFVDGLERQPAEMKATRSSSARGGEDPVLLAVTRSPSAAALLTRYVRGVRTVVLPDLERAREMARRLMPQAVLIDQSREKLDPSELEELGRAWGMEHLPFMTCPLPGEDLLRTQLAVDGYLVKPVSRQSLWDVLRQFGEDVDRVLVVDDDRDFVRMISRMLDSPVRRYQVISAYGGREGLAMIEHRQPDLVLLDLMMPDIDGFEVIKRVRSDPARQHIPIVVVSAQDEVNERQTLAGTITIAKAGGLMPGEVVTWVQNAVGATAASSLVPSVPRATPVS